MKAIQEQIEVMKRFSYGEIVEAYGDNLKEWTIINEPSWNWLKYDYRIKRVTITIEKWLCKDGNDSYYIAEVSDISGYEKVKLLESYEVEL